MELSGSCSLCSCAAVKNCSLCRSAALKIAACAAVQKCSLCRSADVQPVQMCRLCVLITVSLVGQLPFKQNVFKCKR